jgi:hypothetical protein
MAFTFLSKIVPPTWIPYLKFIRKPWNFELLQKDKLRYASDHLYTFINADFIAEPRFANAYQIAENLGKELMPPTGIQWRVYTLCWFAEQVKNLPGDFVACGVYTGFCDKAIINYINFNSLGKTYYLMDTFEGLDERYSTEDELQKKLHYKKAKNLYERVQQTFKDDKVKIIRGAIPETLPLADTNQICFLSIDMNTALPEVEALRYFWGKMVQGGVVILDDYGFIGHEAQKKAHDEFAKEQGTSIYTCPTGQGILIKR